MTDRSQFIHPIFIEISFHVSLVEAPIMGDIYLGLLVLAVLSAATFGIGRAIGRHVTPRTTNWLSVIAVAALMAYIACLWDKTSLVGLLPFSNLIVLGNWLPLEAGFLGGLASTQFAMPGWRRGLTVVGLQLAGVIVVLFPLMGVALNAAMLGVKASVCKRPNRLARRHRPQRCSNCTALTQPSKRWRNSV